LFDGTIFFFIIGNKYEHHLETSQAARNNKFGTVQLNPFSSVSIRQGAPGSIWTSSASVFPR
jgi:hypothetical protein